MLITNSYTEHDACIVGEDVDGGVQVQNSSGEAVDTLHPAEVTCDDNYVIMTSCQNTSSGPGAGRSGSR